MKFWILFLCFSAPLGAAAPLDELGLGNSASERAHTVAAQRSEIVAGAFGQPARRLQPNAPENFDGGSVEFSMRVDPAAQTYVTAKFWGSDHGEGAGRLILYANGREVGYRDQGDYDVLNQSDAEGEAPGRFFYETLPLPLSLTRGRTTLRLKIAALGPMWPYGTTFSSYQKKLSEPSRSIYRIYTDTDAYFVPDPSERQGRPLPAALRPGPGEEVIAESARTVVSRLDQILSTSGFSERPNSEKDCAARLLLLGYAYNTAWTPAFHDHRAVERIIQDGDWLAAQFADDPGYAAKDWPGAGPLGEALALTWPAIGKELGGARRAAWARALRSSVDYWRTHRRSYTNQSMIVDRNIYTANRALQLLAPEAALPEAQTRSYLYQALGLEPWMGSDPRADGKPVEDAPDKGTPDPFGRHYFLVTRKGLSRELGWVGTYGETILHFGCDLARLTQDERIRQQVKKMEDARMCFRYPGVDADGYRCMKLVSEIDNRTAHYPLSGAAYTAPNIREEWWMDVPALLSDDPIAVGAAQQSLADHQYFAYVWSRRRDPDTLGMMRNVDEYRKVRSLPPSSYRLPMTEGQPDFAFADEEDAVIALKDGDTRLFVNLYYRSERGVNSVARICELTPSLTRLATVRTHTEVVWSGRTYLRPDWIDSIRSKGMPPPGEEIHQAWAAEKLPISKRPPDARLPAYGDWGPFVGKAASYRVQYGPYLIIMNCSETDVLPFTLPKAFGSGRDLISGKAAQELAASPLPPLTTAILRLPMPANAAGVSLAPAR